MSELGYGALSPESYERNDARRAQEQREAALPRLRFICARCTTESTDLASLIHHWQCHQPTPRQTHRTILLTDLGAEYLAGSGRSMVPVPADPSIGGANA